MREDWNWLAGTYWYVPTPSLPAPVFSLEREGPLWLSDQTVWQITGSANGYLWGNTAVRLSPAAAGEGQQPPSAQLLTASVTPDGTVHMTFLPRDTADGAQPTVGLGRLRQDGGAWRFEMQMSVAPSPTSLLLHWAFMLQCRPGDPAWQQLPGTGQSLPDFLAAAGFPVEPE